MSRGGQQERPHGRKLAEWITLVVSVLLVLGVAGVLTYEAITGQPRFVAVDVKVRSDQTQPAAGRFIVPVEIHNPARRTLRDVTVRITHDGASRSVQQDLRIDYLGEHATERIYVTLESDPQTLTLTGRVLDYRLD